MLISIGYVTSRKEPRFDWFLDSLRRQLQSSDDVEIILVDFFAQPCDDWTRENVDWRGIQLSRAVHKLSVRWSPPKPTVWSGPGRLPKDNWWSAANARNTALCLARGDFFACVDDRCVLMDGWMEAVREAVKGQYVVCGPYQKRVGITVKDGVIEHAGIVTGEDNRLAYIKEHYQSLANPYSAPGEWLYGCSFGLPLEWALRVNGFDETCDSSSGEDYIFGLMLQNNGYPMYLDTRMYLIEDRSPEALGVPMVRKDKGVSPNDKSHALLAKLRGQRRAQHPWDIRDLRTRVQKGAPWPKAFWPTTDWYDGQPVKEMTP
jgi:hypothetical protein